MRIATRLLVVAALVLGIVMMHHVAGSGQHEETGSGPAPSAGHSADHAGHDVVPGGAIGTGAHDADPEHSATSHGLLHLCLAVLTAAVLLLGGVLVRLRWLPALGARLVHLSRTAGPVPRPPPRRYGAALLTSLCVLRT